MTIRAAVLAVSIGLLLAASPVVAHHAFSAELDSEKPVKLSGVVTKLDWTNPHAWIYVDVKDEAGTVANWGCELASPNRLMRNGWTRLSLKPSDEVNVGGSHAGDRSTVANS